MAALKVEQEGGLESRGEMMATEEEKQVVVRGDIALTWRLG